MPKGQVHTYKLRVDGAWVIDPINPQVVTLENGREWSRFFSEGCQVPLTLSRRERELLGRIVSHLLPFRSNENARFIRGLYQSLDRASRERQFPLAYRLGEEVGVVNYIDTDIAGEVRLTTDKTGATTVTANGQPVAPDGATPPPPPPPPPVPAPPLAPAPAPAPARPRSLRRRRRRSRPRGQPPSRARATSSAARPRRSVWRARRARSSAARRSS